ncbi:tetratricopeptide repeat protein [Massilia sp. G4R7]|uniref:Tetratricopeptide repeat protein n=1 Tax=Massilia phyllostachyos TaxID=2898585 RepID=A0ABS8Q430_9BURK|nr:tetratricopeptide repeat protein [Massilia phyllostachyos]MCD2516505.1 tetratricopeptide repeat protein [Massilia phyllostachyos]
MSLINKMLQDLDARGGQPGHAASAPEIRPVPAPERAFPWLRVALIAGLVAVLGGSGYMAWRLKAAAPSAPAEEVPLDLSKAPPPAPVVREVPVQPAPAEPVEPVAAAPVPEPVQAEPPKPASKRDVAAVKRDVAKAKPAPAAVEPKPAAGRVETTPQRAENGYRRALASLEDGRVTEAIEHLQAALRADPRHDAARQTLVGLLIEAKRPEEAMRQLGAALALDARQPAMAMLLARLQLERGSPGIDTLMRTLPYAAGNGEYHAFLAGALQREERHREAVEQYRQALGTAPQNGVWWMGMGISLQAEKRTPEAMVAFQKARDSGSLTPELQAFVERKLKQFAQ